MIQRIHCARAMRPLSWNLALPGGIWLLSDARSLQAFVSCRSASTGCAAEVVPRRAARYPVIGVDFAYVPEQADHQTWSSAYTSMTWVQDRRGCKESGGMLGTPSN